MILSDLSNRDLIPSREQIAQALSVPDVHHPDLCDCGQPVCGGTCYAEGEDCYCATERCNGLEQQVDAVLALLQGGTETAVRSQIAADIRKALPEVGMGVLVTERRMALRDGMERAARIAEGGTR